MVATNPSNLQVEQIDSRRLWWASPLAGVIAAAANALIYFIAAAAGAFPETVLIPTPGEPMPLTVVQVIINSFVPAIVAGLLLALLNRFTRRPIRIFRVIAVVFLLISFASPLSIPGAPLAMILSLNLMHVVAAAIIVGVLTMPPVNR